MQKGRVRVQMKKEDGSPAVPNIQNSKNILQSFMIFFSIFAFLYERTTIVKNTRRNDTSTSIEESIQSKCGKNKQEKALITLLKYNFLSTNFFVVSFFSFSF